MEKSRYSRLQRIIQERLRKSRIDKGLSQQEIAKRLGKPQSFVSKYESGEKLLNLIELSQICKVLSISLVEFVQQYEEKSDDT